MKKRYTAPDIVFESFALSVSIATCDVGTNQDVGTCGYQFIPGMDIFMEGVDGCTTPTVNGSKEYNGICYDNPSGDYTRLFAS